MAKKTYIVTDPNGVQHTRKTDRVYTHAVAVRASYEFDLAQADCDWAIDGDNWKFAVKMARDGFTGDAPKYSWETPEYLESEKARYVSSATPYSSVEEAIAGRRARRVAGVEKQKAEGYYDKFGILGFNGRLDLAQKAAAAAQGGRWAEVLILEATLKG
ncbi:hypothetical protein HNR26_004786 [Rhizobium rosettiformans]|uniref:Uncharacterized protein n=2 Tax=Rhizobium rosettiformans TaxID=1368430 RepID=A0A4S8PK35_9HYPH|nr:hypothetical protein [Rhizobium rosettiformans]MBB5278684.1 hypothetical protein [Rhizobium rosettiformans]THV29952.1 hypothetical protein FAA86_23105 [Rhizobium rosettiformans W3]